MNLTNRETDLLTTAIRVWGDLILSQHQLNLGYRQDAIRQLDALIKKLQKNL